MTGLERVVWSEGMLMSPQHFQQQDRFHEARLDARVAPLTPHGWGLCALAIDEPALAGGQFVVRELRGVFPGGTPFELTPGARLARGFQLTAGRERLEVHLVVPRERAGAANYERELASVRYHVDARGVLDLCALDREEPIDLARLNLQLRLGDEPREDVDSVQIAEIVRDDGGRPCLSSSYVAPSLQLAAAPSLRRALEALLNACLAKRRAVGDALRHRDAVSIEFGADEVTRYLALSALGGAIPLLKHLTQQPLLSPHHVYVLLAQLVGQLCAFAVEEDPASLPAYDPTSLRETFDPLVTRALALLQLAVPSRVLTLALESRVDGLHLARLAAPELQTSGVRFVVAVQAALPEHTVHELVPKVAKVAAWSEIQRYLSAAVSTVPLGVCTRPPREVPLRPGRQYFVVDAEAAAFRAALREKTLAVQLPAPFAPDTTRVELFAILSE